MRPNRARTVDRLAPVVACGLLVVASGIAGCDCGSDSSSGSTTTTTGTTTGAGGTGTGGSGGAGGGATHGDGNLTKSSVVLNDATYGGVFDAAPSADGSVVYFTAAGIDADGAETAGVYSVPAAGGTPLEIAKGAPFVLPVGLTVSTDGKTLYVADLGAEGDAVGTDGGKIFAVSAEGGAPTEVLSTDDTAPRGVAVVVKDAADWIVFSGRDSVGSPGLFEVPAAGGEPSPLVKGDPFVDPSGLAVGAKSTFVLDTVGLGGQARLIEVTGGAATEFLAGLPVGYPAGIALAQDESAVLVSGLDAKGTTAVLRVDLVSKEITSFPKAGEYDAFFEPGGLHRAAGKDVYAFVDAKADGGTIFLLQ